MLRFLLSMSLLAVIIKSQDPYTTRFDHVNIDSILSNDRLRNNYVKCLLETGKCNKEGATLKEIIPDALKTECKKCSASQQRGIEKIVGFLMKNQAKDWESLTRKYDPKGEYTKKYEERFRSGKSN